MPNNQNFSNVSGSSTGHLYTEQLGNTNLRALMDLQDINNITATANGLIGKSGLTDLEKRARFIEYFYDKVLLDTIKLGNENNVYLKYCKTQEVPAGNSKLVVRRWGGLTEHTFPLAEGIPPKSDRMASESFTGTFCQYGRYMEFTDRVEFQLIDDVIAHYSAEMGDLAVKTAERLCRREMEFFANPVYANSKSSIEDLVIGDTVNIADYRLQALKFSRILVKPINGNYIVICSPEHIYDLVDDPLVEKYMKYTQTATPLETGKPVDLFNIRFEETMLDDYAYGYTEMSNPGEFVKSSKDYCRIVITMKNGDYYYINLPEEAKEEKSDFILQDGSMIPHVRKWHLPTAEDLAVTAQSSADDVKYTWGTSNTVVKFPTKSITVDEATKYVPDFKKVDTNSNSENYGKLVSVGAAISEDDILDVNQLPVHKSFMFGQEFMIKTGVSGRSGAKFYVKAKGSAGVLDPIDQRQSIGFKIDTLGFTCVRPEAIAQFIFVPKQALMTYVAVKDDLAKHYKDGQYANTTNYPDGSVYAAIKEAR